MSTASLELPSLSLENFPALLQEARVRAQRAHRPVLDELEALCSDPPRTVLAVTARALGFPVMETADMLKCQPMLHKLPLATALQRDVGLVQTTAGDVQAVIPDPFDLDLRTWMQARCGSGLTWCLGLRSDIQAYLSKLEESVRAVDSLVTAAAPASVGPQAEVLSYVSLSEGTSQAVNILSSTLYDALKARASDVHLESTALGVTVKYRIDGVLDLATVVTGRDLSEQVISRLKVLAELDISERRVPQDGSFRVSSNGRDIDLRVSIMPSIHGEDAVIRILDKRAMIEAYGALNLATLGFDPVSLASLRALSEEPYGMLLVTGPTGSGKTTTLYAALSELNNGRDKIITIEDPVEYQLAGILQIPVNDKKGLTFARGLRSILRHDPDKIMVGEIRDRETAEIAVQSALTGHLVLTTVHANNVFDVFGRFTHMGIDPYAFVSALNGIWAQRLLRITCPHCAASVTPTAAELGRVGIAQGEVEQFRFVAGRGCGDCRGTGYKGRQAIAEILTLTDEIRELVIERAPIRAIKEAAARSGTRTLRNVALDAARQGLTTLEEVRRVTLHA